MIATRGEARPERTKGARVETWRCATCLSVLPENATKRCPACRSKLRTRRSQPIVLGDVSRLDLQAALPIDRQNRKRLERGPWRPAVPGPPAMPWDDIDASETHNVRRSETHRRVEPATELVLVEETEVVLVDEPEFEEPEFEEPEFEQPAFEEAQLEAPRVEKPKVEAGAVAWFDEPAPRRGLRLMAPALSNRQSWVDEINRRRAEETHTG